MFYVVRFVRRDGKPIEEYYYPMLEQAEEHFSLFLEDDSNLYTMIEITDYEGKQIRKMLFPKSGL